MTSKHDSEVLTRVGPGTPMGELMRQYWIPAAISSELVAGGDPVRLMLLGEKLIAFRDDNDRVGIMDHRCPHRCASLYFGRNEEGGLRCVYHGWKFDTAGNCLDMPNVPANQDFKHKVRAKAYQVHEQNGLVWVYMGAGEAPEMPGLEVAALPAEDHQLFFVMRECNWLQALEGDIDTSHLGFLHMGALEPEDMPEGSSAHHFLVDRAPEYNVIDTDFGTMYGAYRDTDDGQTYWRVAQFAFPFWTMPPGGFLEEHVVARAWVPMDDTHTMFVHISGAKKPPVPVSSRSGQPLRGIGFDFDLLPNTTDWYGRFRMRANAENDYLMDREVQRTESFTGIEGVHLQDQAITESMGGITDHGSEHLAPSDLMVTQTRKRLLRAAKAHKKTGAPPPGVEDPEVFGTVRSGEMVTPTGTDWLDAYADRVPAYARKYRRAEAAE